MGGIAFRALTSNREVGLESASKLPPVFVGSRNFHSVQESKLKLGAFESMPRAFSTSGANDKKNFSMIELPIIDASEFAVDDSENLGAVYTGGELRGYSSAHDVYYARKKEDRSTLPTYVLKRMNKARVGEYAEEVTYSEAEALEQAVLEVLAFTLGNAINPGQFADAKVAQDGQGNISIISKRVHPALSLKELILRNDLDPEDPKQNVFYLGEADNVTYRTKMPKDYLTLPDSLKQTTKAGYQVLDPVVKGRIALKMALYILGDLDERMNKHNNVLVKWAQDERIIDEENKTITPIVELVLVDAGLCYNSATLNEEESINASIKLAAREKDSTKMFDLNGHPPTDLKKVKDDFLSGFVITYESGILERHIEAASVHLSEKTKTLFSGIRSRAKVCYLAGLLVNSGLDELGKQEEARQYASQIWSTLTDKMEMDGVNSSFRGNVTIAEIGNDYGPQNSGRSY